MAGEAHSAEIEAFLAAEEHARTDESLPMVPSFSAYSTTQPACATGPPSESERAARASSCSNQLHTFIHRARKLTHAMAEASSRGLDAEAAPSSRSIDLPDSHRIVAPLTAPEDGYDDGIDAPAAANGAKYHSHDDDDGTDADAEDALLNELFFSRIHSERCTAEPSDSSLRRESHEMLSNEKQPETGSDQKSAAPQANANGESARYAHSGVLASQTKQHKNQKPVEPHLSRRPRVDNPSTDNGKGAYYNATQRSSHAHRSRRKDRMRKRSGHRGPEVSVCIEINGVELSGHQPSSDTILVFKGLFDVGKDLHVDLADSKVPFKRHVRASIATLLGGTSATQRGRKAVIEVWLGPHFAGIATAEAEMTSSALEQFAHGERSGSARLAGGALRVRNPLSGDLAGLITCFIIVEGDGDFQAEFTNGDEVEDGMQGELKSSPERAAREIQRHARGMLTRNQFCGASRHPSHTTTIGASISSPLRGTCDDSHAPAGSAGSLAKCTPSGHRQGTRRHKRSCHIRVEVTVMNADDLPPAHVGGIAQDSVGCYVRYKWPLEKEPFYTHIVPREAQPDFAATAEHTFQLDGDMRLSRLGIVNEDEVQDDGKPLLAFHLFDTSLDSTSAAADVLAAHGSLSLSDVLPQCSAEEAGLENFTTEQELSIPLRSPAVGPAGGSLAVGVKCTCNLVHSTEPQEAEENCKSGAYHAHGDHFTDASSTSERSAHEKPKHVQAETLREERNQLFRSLQELEEMLPHQ